MAERKNRYKQMERSMVCVLGADFVLFVLYLICAGAGITWLKVTLAILGILISGGCIGYLYMTQELLRRRSLWMGTAAAAIAICLLTSLILNFPSPKPVSKELPNDVLVDPAAAVTTIWDGESL